jgi:hypothetical protein
MILSKPSASAYRREADRLLAQITATADEVVQRELLEIARRYERLASYAAKRERTQGWFTPGDDSIADELARA